MGLGNIDRQSSEITELALSCPELRPFRGLQQRVSGQPSFDAWAAHAGLSARERAVAALAVRGLENPEIAAVLGVSPLTVRNQLASVFRKADVSKRAELAYLASTFAPSGSTDVEPPRWLSFMP